MSIELGNAASLVAFTNAQLRGKKFEYTSDHSTLKFARHVPRPENAPADAIYQDIEVIALNPFKWLDYLKREGVTCLKLRYSQRDEALPDHLSAAFVGGGSELGIEAAHGKKSDIYVKGEGVSSGKVRGPHYLLVAKDVEPLKDGETNVDQAIENLGGILQKLENFSWKHERLEHWAQNFRRYRKILEEGGHQYYTELFPEGILPEKNRRLIGGALASWVFGGMGSWNDAAFGEGSELSTDLYKAIYESMCVAVNSQG